MWGEIGRLRVVLGRYGEIWGDMGRYGERWQLMRYRGQLERLPLVQLARELLEYRVEALLGLGVGVG